MRKVYISKFIFILLFGVFITACSSGEDSNGKNEGVTLSVWNRHPELNDTLDDFITKFEEDNPGIKIELENIPVATQSASYQAAVSENSLPDLFTMGGFSLQEYVDLDMVKNLDEFFPQEEQDKYFPGTWFENGTTLNQSVYVMPLFSPNHNTLMMYYNKDVLETVGISEDEIPQNWDDFIKIGQKIYDKTNGNSYGFMFYNDGWAIDSFIHEQSTAIYPETPRDMNLSEGKPDFANHGKVETIEFLKTLYDEKVMHPSSVEIDTFQAEAEFAAGNAAFYINGNWSGSDIMNQDFEHWGVANLPTKDGKQWYSAAGRTAPGLAVSNNTEHWDEVKTFLEYSKEHMYSEVVIKSGASQPAKMDVEGEPPFAQFDAIQDLMTKNAIPVPKPVERNIDIIDFDVEYNELLTIDSIGDIALGYLVGEVNDLEKELNKINSEANEVFNQLLDEYPDISRNLFQFPNWEPFTSYTQEDYEELE